MVFSEHHFFPGPVATLGKAPIVDLSLAVSSGPKPYLILKRNKVIFSVKFSTF